MNCYVRQENEMSEWQPIETAPSGVDLILYVENNMTVVAMLAEQDWLDRCGYNVYPTHWMSLPAPPQDAST